MCNTSETLPTSLSRPRANVYLTLELLLLNTQNNRENSLLLIKLFIWLRVLPV